MVSSHLANAPLTVSSESTTSTELSLDGLSANFKISSATQNFSCQRMTTSHSKKEFEESTNIAVN